jgi:hypothetical protein
VTDQRPFHSLLRRTITSAEAAIIDHGFDHGQIASVAPVAKSWKICKGALVAIMRKLLILTNAFIRNQRKWSPIAP